MKKVNNEIKNIITTIQGKILMIGNYEDKITTLIQNNHDITFCDILTNNCGKKFEKSKKSKKVNIKKLRQYYKKKRLNYLIIEEDKINDYKNTFVKDSIYISNQKIYIIVSSKSNTLKMYKRYTKNIKIIECIDGKIIEVNVENVKSRKYNDVIYAIMNYISELIDFIGNILTN